MTKTFHSLRKRFAIFSLSTVGACQPPAAQPPACLALPPLPVKRDTFRLPHTPPLSAPAHQLSYSQAQRLLKGAYAVGAWLEDSTYVRSYYYAKSKCLATSARGGCHVIVRSTADDFEGLFLIVLSPGTPPMQVYLAGYLGSAGSAGGWFCEAPVTQGVIVSDSVVVTKKGTSAHAFRASGKTSYTDTITTFFRLDYRTGQVIIQKRDSVRTLLTSTFD